MNVQKNHKLNVAFFAAATLDLGQAKTLSEKDSLSEVDKLAIEGLLRSAVSRSYYAVFHLFCFLCAETIVRNQGEDGIEMWGEVYRSVDHFSVVATCEKFSKDSRVPERTRDLLVQVKDFQKERHQADYNPFYSPKISEVEILIEKSGIIQREILDLMRDFQERTRISSLAMDIALDILLDSKRKGLTEARKERKKRADAKRRRAEQEENKKNKQSS